MGRLPKSNDNLPQVSPALLPLPRLCLSFSTRPAKAPFSPHLTPPALKAQNSSEQHTTRLTFSHSGTLNQSPTLSPGWSFHSEDLFRLSIGAGWLSTLPQLSLLKYDLQMCLQVPRFLLSPQCLVFPKIFNGVEECRKHAFITSVRAA